MNTCDHIDNTIEDKHTTLLYMSDMKLYSCQAKVVDIQKSEDGTVGLYLDQTIFYPQGGGQPWDTGTIEIIDSVHPNRIGEILHVIEVRYVDGRVVHGTDSQLVPISIGDIVRCNVDKERRMLNSRLHSAGHLIDMALKEMGKDWKPTKGYHFPNGPYVEYATDVAEIDLELIKEQLEKTCADIIRRNIQTNITFDTSEDKSMTGPGGKPLRTVWYGDFGIQCGGTHVDQLGDIGACRIRKIKKEGNGFRIGYQVE